MQSGVECDLCVASNAVWKFRMFIVTYVCNAKWQSGSDSKKMLSRQGKADAQNARAIECMAEFKSQWKQKRMYDDDLFELGIRGLTCWCCHFHFNLSNIMPIWYARITVIKMQWQLDNFTTVVTFVRQLSKKIWRIVWCDIVCHPWKCEFSWKMLQFAIKYRVFSWNREQIASEKETTYLLMRINCVKSSHVDTGN